MPKARRSTSTVEIGTDFESRIEALYRLLGYHVQRNQHLDSRQFDLICEKHSPGGPTIRLMVECKYRSSGAVPKTEITKFVSEYETLKNKHHVSATSIVTNTAFTAPTRALYANRSDVILVTESELSDELLNVTATLRRFVDIYREDPIYRHYIPLRDAKRGDLITSIDNWLARAQTLYVLHGGFGTGKTTFLRRLKYVLSERYVAGTSSIVPCYFRLRDFARSPDLDAFLRSQLLNEFGSSDISAFRHLLSTGRALLMLDGFDEMGKHSNERSRMDYFAVLTPLFTAGGKYVITCRPSYFVSIDEMTRVFGQLSTISPRDLTLLREPHSPVAQERRRQFDEFETAAKNWTLDEQHVRVLNRNDITYESVSPFSSTDIDRYLQLREADLPSSGQFSWKTMRAKIRDTYDLEDLAKRPILLNLIVETLPKIQEGIEPSPAVIYGHYTAAWLNHEYSKGEVRWLMTKDRKLMFTCSLAYHMYSNDLLRLHYTELPEEIRSYFKVRNTLELSYLVTDIQGSSFLSGDGLGYFEFAHKSFAEFFAAVYIRDQLESGSTQPLQSQLLSQEVLFFLGDLIYVEPELRARVVDLFRKHKSARATLLSVNLLGALGYGRSTISQLKTLIENAPRLRFNLCTLEGWAVVAQASEIYAGRCSLQDVSLHVPNGDLILSKCRVFESDFGTDRQAPPMRTLVATDSSVASSTVIAPRKSASFDGCTISNVHVSGQLPFEIKVFEDADRSAGGVPEQDIYVLTAVRL